MKHFVHQQSNSEFYKSCRCCKELWNESVFIQIYFVSSSSLKYFELFCELPHVGGKDFYQQQKNYRKKFLSPNVNNYVICFLAWVGDNFTKFLSRLYWNWYSNFRKFLSLLLLSLVAQLVKQDIHIFCGECYKMLWIVGI